MRRVRLSNQILVLFFCIVTFATIMFSFLMYSRLTSVYIDETFNRLSTYVEITKKDWVTGNPIKLSDDFEVYSEKSNIKLAYFQGNIKDDCKNWTGTGSKDILNYVDGDELVEIKSVLTPGMAANYIIDSKKAGRLYWTYSSTNDGYFVVFITDSSYVNSLKQNISLQVFLVFALIILMSILVIGLWSRGFVSRIHRIQKHIRSLPRTNYNEGYMDDGNDEIAQLSCSIEKMREELKNNEKIKREMLQNVSHDFKTPVAVIKSYAEAMEDGVAGIEACEIIITQAEIIKHKVNKLLQYNRLEYLSKDKEFEPVNMKAVITDIVNTYTLQKNIRFETELDDVYFVGYKENYYTVVDNIVDNAMRYAKSIIKITLKNDKLVIYNDGEPIDEQFLTAAFKPYEKGSKGQFGLGMSIVKKTLEFFEMQLAVENVESGGVSFIITKKT